MARAVVWSMILLVLHLVAGALVLYVLLDVVPGFRHTFEELDMDLPAPTVLLCQASDLAARYWYAIVPLTVFVDFAVLFSLSWLGKRAPGLVWVWFSLVLLAALCFLAFALIGLTTPLRNAMDGLAG